MTSAEITDLTIGTLQGLGASTIFLLALFIGVCVALAVLKLRRGSRKTLVFRNFDDLDGEFVYLPPDAPRGPADQLRTPELLEQASRKG